MDDGHRPAEVALSPGERVVLRRIEAELGADRRLARRLRHPASRLCAPLTLAALTCASLVLAALGVSTSEPVLVWSFAAVWPCTLLTALRLLCRVTRPGQPTTTPWL